MIKETCVIPLDEVIASRGISLDYLIGNTIPKVIDALERDAVQNKEKIEGLKQLADFLSLDKNKSLPSFTQGIIEIGAVNEIIRQELSDYEGVQDCIDRFQANTQPGVYLGIQHDAYEYAFRTLLAMELYIKTENDGRPVNEDKSEAIATVAHVLGKYSTKLDSALSAIEAIGKAMRDPGACDYAAGAAIKVSKLAEKFLERFDDEDFDDEVYEDAMFCIAQSGRNTRFGMGAYIAVMIAEECMVDSSAIWKLEKWEEITKLMAGSYDKPEKKGASNKIIMQLYDNPSLLDKVLADPANYESITQANT